MPTGREGEPAVRCYVNGRLDDAGVLGVSPFDHGLLVGDGVFETLRTYAGVPFAWRRHDERLRRSAAGLGLRVPPSAELRDAAEAVLAANGLTDARLRITVTGGPSPLGSERGDGPPTVIVAASPLGPPGPPASVVVVPWCRNERGATAGLKTISYAENVRALAWARDRGGEEAIFANTHGDLCEATGSNVFVVHGGVLRTPPASSGCLEGVTRALLLELAARLGIPTEAEVPLPLDALRRADEAFLSSSTREVQPIAAVDGTALATVPGPVTERLAEEFRAWVRTDPDP